MPYRTIDYSEVLWDERGSPYWRAADGSRVYIPPASAMSMWDNPRVREWAKAQGYTAQQDPTTGQASVTATNRPGTSLFRQGGVWNSDEGNFDRPINWGNVLSMGVGGLIAAPLVAGAVAGGAGSAGAGAGGAGTGAGGAGGAAAGGTLASASIPGLHAAVPAGIASQGASVGVPLAMGGAAGAGALGGLYNAAPAGIASQGASAGTALPGAAGAAGGGTSLASRLFGGENSLLDVRDLLGLGLAGGSLFAGGGTPAAQDQLNALLATAQGRVNATEPLFQNLLRMTNAQLPRYAKEG
jgi:hypothetical protein